MRRFGIPCTRILHVHPNYCTAHAVTRHVAQLNTASPKDALEIEKFGRFRSYKVGHSRTFALRTYVRVEIVLALCRLILLHSTHDHLFRFIKLS